MSNMSRGCHLQTSLLVSVFMKLNQNYYKYRDGNAVQPSVKNITTENVEEVALVTSLLVKYEVNAESSNGNCLTQTSTVNNHLALSHVRHVFNFVSHGAVISHHIVFTFIPTQVLWFDKVLVPAFDICFLSIVPCFEFRLYFKIQIHTFQTILPLCCQLSDVKFVQLEPLSARWSLLFAEFHVRTPRRTCLTYTYIYTLVQFQSVQN